MHEAFDEQRVKLLDSRQVIHRARPNAQSLRNEATHHAVRRLRTQDDVRAAVCNHIHTDVPLGARVQ